MADLRISDLTAHTTGVLAAADLVEVSQESGGTFTSRKMTGAQLKATTNNFANADLTFSANRSHDLDGKYIIISNTDGVESKEYISVGAGVSGIGYSSTANGISRVQVIDERVDIQAGGLTYIDASILYGLMFNTLPTYADEAAAVTGGLTTDAVYKTATGELRIKL